MLTLTRLRELNLQLSSHPLRPPYVLAASGLVRVGSYLYVVADDELQLAVFRMNQTTPGELLRLFPGELPVQAKQRKRLKPDLEILTRLPAFDGYPDGALLALGSGALPTRYRGALIPLDGEGAVRAAPQIIDAEPLFASLQQHLQPLNLEGAWAAPDQFCLLQRGNKSGSINAVVRLPLMAMLDGLANHRALPGIAPISISAITLGDIDGVPLCFSDACAMPDGHCLFTAVAEDVDNAVADGKFLGAAIGMLNAADEVIWIKQVTPPYKIEGIDAHQNNGGVQLLLVTDADDAATPSLLLTTMY